MEALEDRTTPSNFLVTNFTDSVLPVTGTLRSAIFAANLNPGHDTITFALPAHQSAVATINLVNPLVVTDPVTIDGSLNILVNGRPTVKPGVELNGAAMPSDLSSNGLVLRADGCTIKGLIVNRFGSAGIYLVSNNNVVQGCYVGTNKDGSAALFQSRGITIEGNGNLIGGATTAARNVISGNTANVYFEPTALASGNTVQGNFIGTNAAGTIGLSAFATGIDLGETKNNDIVGNLISGNGIGVIISGSSATGNRVRANKIGVAVDGTTPLPNTNVGVVITAISGAVGARNNIIGGSTPSDGNVIAFNANIAVELTPSNLGVPLIGAGPGNSILNNRIFGSPRAIDLGSDGPTLNDPLDADTGPNNLQNTGVLSAAGPASGSTLVTGTFNSTPFTPFRFQFFQTTSIVNGIPQNMAFLGDVFATSDFNGNVSISSTFAQLASGTGVLMTATNTATGDTSEFSKIVIVSNNPPMIREDVLTPNIDEGDFATLSGRLVDADLGDVLTLRVNWGDGSPLQDFHPGLDPFAFTHRYVNDGVYDVNFTWLDNHGGSNTRTRQVTVHNVAPRFADLDLRRDEAFTDQKVLLSGRVFDPGADVVAVTINWGDGTIETVTLGRDGKFRLKHQYREPGRYTIQLTATDDNDGLSMQSLVIDIAPHPGKK